MKDARGHSFCLLLAWVLQACSSSAGASSTEVREPVSAAGSSTLARAVLADEGMEAARVLGFGETTHGTREFRAIVHEVAMQLAQQEPELTIAMELNPGFATNLNEWIHGCGNIGHGDQAALAFPSWPRIERSFLASARAHNLRRQGCIRIVGVDAPVGPYLPRSLRWFGRRCLGTAWDGALDGLVGRLEQLAPHYGTNDNRPRDVFSQIDARSAEGREGTHCDELEWWLTLIERHIEIPQSETEGWLVPDFVNSVDRDRLMADSVAFWAERSRVVFLAHAGHVAKTEIPGVHGGGSTKTAGLHLARVLGDDYRSVALVFGGVLASRPDGAAEHERVDAR